MNENLRLVWDIDNAKLQEATRELEELRKKYGAVAVESKKSAKESGDAFKSVGEQIHKVVEIAKTLLAALAVKELIQEWIHFSDEMHKMRRIAASFSSEVGSALDAIAVKAHSLSKTFSEDYSQILKTANVLADEYQVSMMQALKSIEEGFKRGANATANYNQLFQLGAHNARAAGYTYDQFLKIIDKVAASGVRAQRVITTIFDKKQNEEGSKYGYILAAANEELRTLTIEQQKYYDYMGHWLEKEELFIAAQQTAVNAWGVTTRMIKEKVLPILTQLATLTFTNDMMAQFAAMNAEIELSGKSTEELTRIHDELLMQLAEQEKIMEEQAETAKKAEEAGHGGMAVQYEEAATEAAKLKAEIAVLNKIIKQSVELAGDKAGADEEIKKVNAAQAYKDEAAALAKLNAEYRKLFPYLQAIGFYIDKSLDKIKAFGKALAGKDEFEPGNESLTNRIDLMSRLAGIEAKRGDNAQKEEESRMKLSDKEIKFEEDKEEALDYLKEQGFQKAAGFVNQLYDLKSQRIQLELEELNESTQNLLANDKLADYQRERIENEANKRRKELLLEQAKNQRSQAIFSAIINTAEQVTSVIANPILASIVAALGAAQIAIIASQPLPKMKKGGPIKGPSHEQGGVVAELEGGEFVINKSAARKYDSILKEINSMQLNTDILVNGKKQSTVNINTDSPEMLKELKRLKTTNINIDERGFMVRQWNLYGSQKRQVHRFFD